MTKISELTAGTTPTGVEKIPALQGGATVELTVTQIRGSNTPGGSDTQVQYKSGSSFAGISGATSDGTTLTLVAPVLGAATGTSLALNGAASGGSGTVTGLNTQNAATYWNVTNASAGTAAITGLTLTNNNGASTIGAYGTGFSNSLFAGRLAFLSAAGSGALITTSTAQPIVFGIANVESGRFLESATGTLRLGVAGTTVGSLMLTNATSGTQSVTPATGALGTGVATLVAGTYDLVGTSLTQTVTNKTYDNTNAVTLKDTLFTLQDDGDTSKQAKFQLSGITTATTRTYTLPDATDTVAVLAASQALTNKTYNGNTLTAGTFTLTGAAAKTLTFNNTITMAGTDATTMTFPTTTATIARTDASQTFTGTQTFAAGSAATPGVTVGTAGYGLYQPAANQLGMALAGIVLFDFGISTVGKFTYGAALIGQGTIKSTFSLGGIGYDTGAGGAVSQGTNRTTGVTLNAVCGAITLFSQVNAAVSLATALTFTVTNSAVAATDTIVVSQKSGTDKYHAFVTAVAAGSFAITHYSTGGTTNEAPVFNFAILKAVAA